jgi:transposase
MKAVYRRCCGIDVHKETVVVCVLAPDGQEKEAVKRTFGTVRRALVRLRVWLQQMRVTEIAMESTGIYWVPVWNVLEGASFSMMLVNPQQVKALQGRKSDARDCQRIAELLQDRRLDPSFVPPVEIRELRTMTRHRVALLEQRNQVQNQIRDLLETACVKLSSVASNILGVTGTRILEAIADGESSAERLSRKARGRLRQKEDQIKEAVDGQIRPFHRQMLESYLKHYEFLTSQIEQLEIWIEERMQPYSDQIALLRTIPGIEKLVAWNLLAELGPDMSVFPDAAHCASWAGLTPGSHESAGKQHNVATKKGNRFLRRILTQSAWAVSHKKEGYLRAAFHRYKARRGWGKAIVAVAHKLIVIAYHVLRDNTPYRELGTDYFDLLDPERTARRLAARLGRLGYQVTLSRSDPPPPVPLPAPSDAPPKRKPGRPRKYPLPDNTNPTPPCT